MKISKIKMLAALCGFFVSSVSMAATLSCYNPSPDMQVCTGSNGYTVTCTKFGNTITCTGSDGKTTTIFNN